MMKFILYNFMIPLSLSTGGMWVSVVSYIILFVLFLFSFSFSFSFFDTGLFFGCDYISYFLILLTIWICGLMILASESIYGTNYYYNFFLLTVLFLMLSLFLTFSSMNLFIFYLFFEMSLIPTFILILGWGYQPERIQAGMYMFFYTLLASLPMMISLFLFTIVLIRYFFLKFTYCLDYLFLFVCMVSVFLVKIPMFFVHLWLPKAHVEAPVSGSMILAGIMLKLGGYGFFRLMPLFLGISKLISVYFVVISLVGGFIVSLMCLRQSDIKSLIAYSSVAHMGMVLAGIMTMNMWGYWGAFAMMISHGLCSSGLFCLSNISYERFGSRSLFLNKGLINLMPSMTLWWFLLSSSNMAAPPSFNLLGEIMLINSLVSWSIISMLVLMFLSFFAASYSLYLYSFSQHGKLSFSGFSMSSGSIREYLLLFLHWVPLNLLFLMSDIFLS
uniref:NADH-ubiquinone oxidoreductase chain 4 n=1 Tax=Cantharidae sp. GENSP01 TaxID=1205542 RepID=A0A0S2MSB5_9COLE|nr:NADH deshydrogenase subunit 4 [Cantharidae sp. GENSP01]